LKISASEYKSYSLSANQIGINFWLFVLHKDIV